jgi:hypothetical protein
MKEKLELQRALLQEEIDITKKLLSIGYYPFGISFHGDRIEINARQSNPGQDQRLLNEMIKDLSSIDEELQNRSRK